MKRPASIALVLTVVLTLAAGCTTTGFGSGSHEVVVEVRPAAIVQAVCPVDGGGLLPPYDGAVPGGSAPAGFIATRVVHCVVTNGQFRDDGGSDYSIDQLTGRMSTALETTLALPDLVGIGAHEACAANFEYPQYLLLVDADGRAYQPRIPQSACGTPRLQVGQAIDAIAWTHERSFTVAQSA